MEPVPSSVARTSAPPPKARRKRRSILAAVAAVAVIAALAFKWSMSMYLPALRQYCEPVPYQGLGGECRWTAGIGEICVDRFVTYPGHSRCAAWPWPFRLLAPPPVM